MKTKLAVGLAVLLAIASVKSETLPGSCAIVASQAYAKVEDCYWRVLISMDFIDPDDYPFIIGHMICVWQPFEGSHLLAYNITAFETSELNTSSHKLSDIKKAISEKSKLVITDAHFLR